MIIDGQNPIFPHPLSAKNDFGEFSDAFSKNEEAALSAIAMEFCGKSISISDEFALKGIMNTYQMMDQTNTGRMQKFNDKFKKPPCEKAAKLLLNE